MLRWTWSRSAALSRLNPPSLQAISVSRRVGQSARSRAPTTNHLPNWWDLAAIAAFSLVIYYWAVHSTLPHQRVSAAVEQVETEASVELEKSLV